MKKETIGILFVSLVLVVGGMFALWITTAPAEGDGWTYIEPIVEDTTTNITIEHENTNATVIATWGTLSLIEEDSDQYLNYFKVRDKETLLDNFEKVYTVVAWQEWYYADKDADTREVKSYASYRFDFYILATEGTLVFMAHETALFVKMPTAHFLHWNITQTDDQTTYTFHYPKIIGWEDP